MKNKAITIGIFLLFIVVTFTACTDKTQIKETESAKTQTIQIETPDGMEEDIEEQNTEEEIKTQDAVENEENTSSETIVSEDTKVTSYRMETPSFKYYLSDKVKIDKNQLVALKMISESTNQITDERQWFQSNNLTMNTYELPDESSDYAGNLPTGVEIEYQGLKIVAAFYDDSYIYCVYGMDYSNGNLLQVYDKNSIKLLYTLDFSNYAYSPEYEEKDFEFISQAIKWASIKDDILYISHSHNTYAQSSHYMNGYITAIDLSDKSILWRSEPLVQNAANFLVQGNMIICGYGFTAESDYLYQLDITTGKIIDSIELKSAPYYILKKDNTLYVRTYNTNYEFEID